MSIPSDPIILLSFINTKLRDSSLSLDDLCSELDADASEIVKILNSINYYYDITTNQFK